MMVRRHLETSYRRREMDTNFKRVEKGREEREKALAEVRESVIGMFVCALFVSTIIYILSVRVGTINPWRHLPLATKQSQYGHNMNCSMIDNWTQAQRNSELKERTHKAVL